MAQAHATLRNHRVKARQTADWRAPAAAPVRGADSMIIELTEDERSRMIAGLAFFRSRKLGSQSSPWSQMRAAEAEIDAVLRRFATQVGAPR